MECRRPRNVCAAGADWTIIISAAVRFGESGGLDLVEWMEQNPDAICVEAGRYKSSPEPNDGFGWHLIAVHRRTFDDVGLFDENFWPGYVEDTDWCHRCRTFYKDRHVDAVTWWPRVPVDGDLASKGHGVDKGGVRIQRHGQMEHYIAKWGGGPTQELWEHPFGDPNNPVSYWPEPAPRDTSPRVWRHHGRSHID